MHEKHLTTDKFFTDDRPIFTQMILNYEDPGLHDHTFIEFFYVLDGQSLHILNGEKQEIRCGDAYLLTPGDEHRFQSLGSRFLHRDVLFKPDYFRSVCTIYAPDFYDKLISGAFKKHLTFTVEQLNRLETTVQPLILDSGENADLLAADVCTYILNTLIEQNLPIQSVAYPAWITRLLSLLSAPENFRKDQQLLTSAFSYSQEYVCRTFKKVVGKTVTDYFNEQKMKYAYSLLQTSTYSIEQICERINFNNVSYFYRLFKKHFGITPREVIPSVKPLA